MSIELAAATSAIASSAPIDFEDPALLPDAMTKAWIGVDLSALGATASESVFDMGCDLPVEHLNFPRLACAVNAAHGGGIDFVSLGSQFYTRSDFRVRNAALDGVKAAAKLAEVTKGGLSVSVPASAHYILQAIDSLVVQREGWAALAIDIDTDTDVDALITPTGQARMAGIKIITVISSQLCASKIAAVAAIADMVRLRITDPHVAREIRFAVRSAAEQLNKEIPVVVDLGIVISASTQAAEERAYLVSAMSGQEIFAGIASSVGTVYDVADTIEAWVGLGAADGVMIVPASLPTDMASILKGVLPLLAARTVDIG